MTGGEALAVLSDLLEGRNVDGDPTEALAVLRSGLQLARALAELVDRSPRPPRGVELAADRFRAWESGERS